MRRAFLFGLLCLVYRQANAAAPTFYTPGPGGTTKSIPENINPGNSVYDLIGSDADGDSLAYSIKSQTPSSPAFTIGGAELKAPSGLDAETATSFSLVFTVSDGTSNTDSVPLVITVTDVNEFTPQFSGEPYSGSIQDGTAAGTTVTTVTATDQDVTDTVSYTITAGDSSNTFAIDSSGAITVSNAGNVNSTTTPSYSLTVRASAGTDNTDTTVTITVTANPCNPNPCQNSGTCSASGSSATCTCTSGYIGATCDTVDYCASSPCQNSGTCTNDASTFSCSCASGFIGNQCQTAVTANQGSSGNSDGGNKLGDGAIAGIVVGSVAAAVLSVGLIYYAFTKRPPRISSAEKMGSYNVSTEKTSIEHLSDKQTVVHEEPETNPIGPIETRETQSVSSHISTK